MPAYSSRFSSAIRTTKVSISPAVRGRPGARFALPSYFWVINLRCQSEQSLGRHNGCHLRQELPSQSFGLSGQVTALVVVEAQALPPSCSRRTRFSSRIIDHVQLALVHPPGEGDQHEPKWIQHSRHVGLLSQRAVKNRSEFKQFQYSDHTRSDLRERQF